MKHKLQTFFTLTMATIIILSMLSGCKQQNTTVNANEIVEKLLTQISFSTELKKVEKNAELYFPDLPEGSLVELYTGNGYFADEVALITLSDESFADDAMKIIETHLSELKNQFLNYVPKEVGKIENAVVSQKGKYIFICITNDYNKASSILSGKDNATNNVTNEKKEETQTTSEKNQSSNDDSYSSYPSLKSKSGTYRQYKNSAIGVDNSGFELYSYVDSSATKYAELINNAAKSLQGKTKVYDLAIPTAIGIILPDDIKDSISNSTDQKEALNKLFSKMSNDVITVNCYDNMMKHRDEYIYFRTDYHWNGKGAFYAYESFCKAKGISAIPLSERKEKQFDGFLGEIYWKNSNKDSNLGNTPDTVFAYYPKSENATMEYTDMKGNKYPWDIISDVTNWKASTKYSTFSGGDNPISVFKNSDIKDNSVCVIVKESYGNALLPFLIDHYNTIYEIDYRYWNGNLIDFVKEKGANDLIFANNLSMIRSNYLIGKLSGIMG